MTLLKIIDTEIAANKAKGISQAEICRRAGMQYQSLQKLRRDLRDNKPGRSWRVDAQMPLLNVLGYGIAINGSTQDYRAAISNEMKSKKIDAPTLAKKTGFSTQWINNMLNGAGVVYDSLVKLCEGLGAKVEIVKVS